MAKKKLTKKKEVIVKDEKVIIETAKKVDLTNLPCFVDIIALKDRHLVEGATYNVTKECAIILITKGSAKLK